MGQHRLVRKGMNVRRWSHALELQATARTALVNAATPCAGGALGPIVSGALLEAFWWGSAVLVNLPFVAVTFSSISVPGPRYKASGPSATLQPRSRLPGLG